MNAKQERMTRYLEALAESGQRPLACRAAGVVAKTVSLWRRDDESFAEAEADAEALSRAQVIEETRLRAKTSDSLQGLVYRAALGVLQSGVSVQVGVQNNINRDMAEADLEGRLHRMNQESVVRGDGAVLIPTGAFLQLCKRAGVDARALINGAASIAPAVALPSPEDLL